MDDTFLNGSEDVVFHTVDDASQHDADGYCVERDTWKQWAIGVVLSDRPL